MIKTCRHYVNLGVELILTKCWEYIWNVLRAKRIAKVVEVPFEIFSSTKTRFKY